MDPSDQSLLQRYVSHGDEAAFADLVARHGGLIFSLALRRTGNRGLAEEITQNIFALLAQKGAVLVEHPALLAWMQKTAHYQSERAAAKEFNRQRLMKSFYEARAIEADDEGASPVIAEHLPILDEALAALPESDRQILLLRFWRKAPYKMIAQSQGATVQACEKRAGRALNRIGRFLRQRGVVLPTAAVVAGLSHATSQAALPAEFAAALLPSALKTAPLMAGSQKLLFLAMMKTKLTFIAIAILAFGLAGFTGWSAAKQSIASSSSANAHSDEISMTGPGKRGQDSSADQAAQQRRISLETLLRQAREALHRGKIDLAAKDLAAAKIAQIHFEDIPAAMEMIEKDQGFVIDADLTAAVLSRWAEYDGAAACTFSLKLKQPQLSLHPIMYPLKKWAARDPQAAFDWFQARTREGKGVDPAPEGEWIPISNIRWIMGEWALQDPVATARVIGMLDKKAELQGAIIGLSEASSQATNRTVILDAIAAQFSKQEESERWGEMRNLFERWSTVRPQEIAEWLDQQGIAASNDSMVNQPVLKAWLPLDAAGAVDWWLNRSGGYPGRATKLRGLMEAWTPVDAFAAAEWLATQPMDADASEAISVLTMSLKETDPERAFTWAKAIAVESARSQAMSNALQAWHTKDPAAAEQALAEANFSDVERAAIQQSFTVRKP